MDERRLEKMDKLARDILTLSRNTLLVNLRFLDAALSQFQYVRCDTSTLLTDGHFLLYNPPHVLRSYKHEKEIPVRDYLHIVLHCIYRHMFMSPNIDRPLWDLACDIAVESTITGLGLPSAAAGREAKQKAELDKLSRELKMVTAEKIYRYYLDAGITPAQAADLRGLFYADDHEIWYMTVAEIEVTYGVSLSGDSGSGDGEGEGQGCGGDGDGQQEQDGEDKKITSQEEFDEYLRTMTLRGLGGTDFRPVFRRVDEMIKNHEFINLKGLIYFTDGYGTFPECKPDYDAAFVFIDDEYNNPDVPPWAIKLILQKEEI